jgi:hypothetical protein
VVHGALHERGDFGFLLHVRFDEYDVAATGLNLGGDALAALDIPIGEGYVRSFGDEAPHRGLPNPRRSARDGGHFPTQLSHRHCPLLLCVMPDPVRTLALLVWCWSTMIRARVGPSHGLCHRQRALTLSSTLRYRSPPRCASTCEATGQAAWRGA